jgi:hypothetical protein
MLGCMIIYAGQICSGGHFAHHCSKIMGHNYRQVFVCKHREVIYNFCILVQAGPFDELPRNLDCKAAASSTCTHAQLQPIQAQPPWPTGCPVNLLRMHMHTFIVEKQDRKKSSGRSASASDLVYTHEATVQGLFKCMQRVLEELCTSQVPQRWLVFRFARARICFPQYPWVITIGLHCNKRLSGEARARARRLIKCESP